MSAADAATSRDSMTNENRIEIREKPRARSVPISLVRFETWAYIVIVAPMIAPSAKKKAMTMPRIDEEEAGRARLLLVVRALAHDLQPERLVALHVGLEGVELRRRRRGARAPTRCWSVRPKAARTKSTSAQTSDSNVEPRGGEDADHLDRPVLLEVERLAEIEALEAAADRLADRRPRRCPAAASGRRRSAPRAEAPRRWGRCRAPGRSTPRRCPSCRA